MTPSDLEFRDDDLGHFESHGAAPLPAAVEEGHVAHDGADIWYATYGSGPTAILLHGGLGHSGNWGHQVPMLVGSGRRVLLVDSRGHGRSTRDARPYTYELMAGDLLAVMDRLGVARAPLVGWSDGACTALILARMAPERVSGVFFFGCAMDPSGLAPFEFTPIVRRCFHRHAADYAALSATPDAFDAFSDAVGEMMKTQPNVTAEELAAIRVPVTVVHGERDEFIRPEHAAYLARTIPGAALVRLSGVSHFAPLQRPEAFGAAVRAFLEGLPS
jgi:pimeloyl-ACP methyl ester carboxylesterase